MGATESVWSIAIKGQPRKPGSASQRDPEAPGPAGLRADPWL